MTRNEQTALADATERDLAANDLSTTYVVEAAAGTGKTTLLVSRILCIVRTTLTPLSRVAAITFTEKAAGELKIKLRHALEGNASGTDEEAERCQAALRELDSMPVSTIHAFCRDLIAQRPVEADIEPGFAVMDEGTATALRDDVWQTWIAAELARDCPAARRILEQGVPLSGRRGLSLRAIYELMIDRREDLDRLHVVHESESALQQRAQEFRSRIESALPLRSACLDPDDTLVRQIALVAEWMDTAKWNGLDEITATLASRPVINRNREGRKQAWPAEALVQARRFFKDEFNAEAEWLQNASFTTQAAALAEWLKGGVRAYAEAKAERGLLDFHDLLLMARDMLSHHRTAREFFKSRTDYLLVDEFQDTDPLQVEIAFFLAERGDRFATEWEQVELEHGKLFIVGDPKQSIYRFRRADLDLYGRVRAKVSESGVCLPISVSFRSHPTIIEEMNDLFKEWMTGPTGTHYEPEHVAMVPYRCNVDSGPRLEFLCPCAEETFESAEEAATGEATCVAEYVKELVGSGRAFLDEEGMSRALRWGDVAVLYPTTTRLDELQTALRARSIPYQVSGGRDLPRRSEIQALCTALRAVDNPCDEVHVVGALRSPFFGCSDEELLDHRLDGSRFDYTRDTSAVPHIERAFAVLRTLHDTRRTGSCSETVAALFEQTAGLHVFALKPQGEARVGNLLRVLDMARSLERDARMSFHRFTRWIERLDELRVGEDDFAAQESDSDAVRLMTFHKAKGLEFPAVVLYHLSHGRDRTQGGALLDRTSAALEMRHGGVQTAGFAELAETEKDRERHEMMRLLYVAATRARELLAVPAYWTAATGRAEGFTFYRLLERRYPRGADERPITEGTRFTVHDTSHFDRATSLQEHLAIEIGRDVPAATAAAPTPRQQWRKNMTRRAAELLREQRFVRPSARDADLIPTPSPIAHGARGREFGVFVHRALERVSLPYAEDLEIVVREAAGESRLGEVEIADALRLIREALRSDLFTKRVLRATRWWRELEFTAAWDDAVAEGAIDLVFFEDGRAVIVDFKTDQVSASETRARALTYLRQASVYARALEAAANCTVKEAILFFMRPGRAESFGREELLRITP